MSAARRIHIVGVSPRTGTTLLAECMAACFHIDAVEPHEASLLRLRRGAGTYLTKKPADLVRVEPRLRLDRHFHAICLMRDPRDVVVSRHGLDPNRYWAPLRIWKQRYPLARRLAGHERFLLVRYEDLVRDPDGTQAELQRRLPFLQTKHPFSTYSTVATPSTSALRALGGLRRFDTASVGQWRNHLPRLAGQLAQHGPIDAELVELGYETDASWLSRLGHVAPDLERSHLPDEPRSGLLGRLRRTRLGLPWASAAFIAAARAMGVRVS